MDFDPSDYVQPGSPQDRFRGREARIDPCRYCGRPLFLRDDEDADCGMHVN
jgi:hypothetical protein